MSREACIGYTARSGSQRISPPRICGAPATEIITAGCAHEHIGDRPVCDFHAEDLRALNMLCGNCLDAGGRSHDCWLAEISARAA